MNYINELIKSPGQRTQHYEARIANTVNDPGDDVFVKIPQFDEDSTHPHRHGPCGWSPRPTETGVEYPSVDDWCVVAISDQGRYWILQWWPYD